MGKEYCIIEEFNGQYTLLISEYALSELPLDKTGALLELITLLALKKWKVICSYGNKLILER